MKFHTGELAVQERAGERATAEEIGAGIGEFVNERAREFLRLRQAVVLGTVDSGSRVWASVVTGAPGFVSAPDPRTVRIEAVPPPGDPARDNLAVDAQVAMLAVDFLNPRRLRVNGRGVVSGGAIIIRTEQVYGNCRRYIQERIFIGARDAHSPGEAARATELGPAQNDQIARADTFFIASDHPEHGADVSHRGGAPGFVSVLDACHLRFPDYNGNRMFNTLGNLAVNPRAGLLFIDFESGATLQLTGAARIEWNPELARSFAGAERLIDFTIEEVIGRSNGFSLLTRFRQYSRNNPQPAP